MQTADEDREKLFKEINELLARGASYEEFPDGVTWADVSEAEMHVAVRAEGSGPNAGRNDTL